MNREGKLTIATATGVLAVLGRPAVYAQDKYSLKSPSGIAFSDFRGYDDWAVRRLSSSKRTAKDFRIAADGATRCSTTKPHPTSSQPIPAPQIAGMRAMWP